MRRADDETVRQSDIEKSQEREERFAEKVMQDDDDDLSPVYTTVEEVMAALEAD